MMVTISVLLAAKVALGRCEVLVGVG